MSIDILGIFKDNSKLILALVGLFVVTGMMATTDMWKANGPSSVGNPPNVVNGDNTVPPNQNSNRVAMPVNNGFNNRYATEPAMVLENGVNYQARINTNLGSISIDLFENIAPANVNSFIFLAREGFYNGTSFHRIITNYIVQGGDPLGTGFGGPGYYVRDEISSAVEFKPYVVAMANSGVNSNGSQFFITTRKTNSDGLDGLYTIIGEVTSGFNVVDSIEATEVNASYLPYDPVLISSIQIIEF